jgi:hypothetical protein
MRAAPVKGTAEPSYYPTPPHPTPPAHPLLQNGQEQLVLLDHGLYKQIDDDFRGEYAALWRSLVLADHEGIRRHSAAMNAGDAYVLFACECPAALPCLLPCLLRGCCCMAQSCTKPPLDAVVAAAALIWQPSH